MELAAYHENALELERRVRLKTYPIAIKLLRPRRSQGRSEVARTRLVREAQAMARPVVATTHGGSLETVVDGKTGWLVPPADPKAMADALMKYETIDSDQIRDIMEGRDPRPPAGWEWIAARQRFGRH